MRLQQVETRLQNKEERNELNQAGRSAIDSVSVSLFTIVLFSELLLGILSKFEERLRGFLKLWITFEKQVVGRDYRNL